MLISPSLSSSSTSGESQPGPSRCSSPSSLSSSSASGESQPGPSRCSSPSSLQPQKRKGLETTGEAADRVLIQSIQSLQECSRERQSHKEDIDVNFGLEVAGHMKRIIKRQNAIAKIQIQQFLFDIEFQGEGDQPPYHGNQFEFFEGKYNVLLTLVAHAPEGYGSCPVCVSVRNLNLGTGASRGLNEGTSE